MNLLRHIPAFRALLADKATLERELSFHVERAVRADQEMRFWRERSEKWEAEYKEALTGRVKATETVADFSAQLRWGRKIFDHAPDLPEQREIPKPIYKNRVQARTLVQQAEADFDNKERDMMRRFLGNEPLAQRSAEQSAQ